MSDPTKTTPAVRRLSQLEKLEHLFKKNSHQFGDRKEGIETMVARLRTRRFIGSKQTDPIWEAVFEARFAYFMAKFAENNVPEEKFLAWQRDMAGKKHGQIFYEAGKLLAEAKAKLPMCSCERHRLTYAPNKTLYKLCWECARERKADRRDAQRAPAHLSAPSKEDHAAIVGSPQKVLMTAAIIGLGLPSVTAKPPRRRKANSPRVFGDNRDAGERRAWAKREEFKLYGAKKHRGERGLAE